MTARMMKAKQKRRAADKLAKKLFQDWACEWDIAMDNDCASDLVARISLAITPASKSDVGSRK